MATGKKHRYFDAMTGSADIERGTLFDPRIRTVAALWGKRLRYLLFLLRRPPRERGDPEVEPFYKIRKTNGTYTELSAGVQLSPDFHGL